MKGKSQFKEGGQDFLNRFQNIFKEWLRKKYSIKGSLKEGGFGKEFEGQQITGEKKEELTGKIADKFGQLSKEQIQTERQELGGISGESQGTHPKTTEDIERRDWEGQDNMDQCLGEKAKFLQ